MPDKRFIRDIDSIIALKQAEIVVCKELARCRSGPPIGETAFAFGGGRDGIETGGCACDVADGGTADALDCDEVADAGRERIVAQTSDEIDR